MQGPHAQSIALTLRTIARRSLADTPLAEPSETGVQRHAYLDGFADEFGNRRTTDRPLLARLLSIDPGPAPERRSEAAGLLWAAHDHTIHPGGLLLEAPDLADPRATGPLVYEQADSSIAIEWRTLDELTALHALWNLAVSNTAHHPATQRATWRERCLNAARWHIAELQPDNATNHPWGIAVFYELAWIETDRSAAASAQFHAETLLHNCQVQQGRPDLVSAFILLDAANALAAK